MIAPRPEGTTAAPRLRDHQVEGVDFLRPRLRSLLFDEPGMGKTAQLLHAAEGETLVVAPANALAAGVWTDEIALWEPALAADLDTEQVAYSSLTRRERTGTTASSTRPLPIARREVLDRRWDTIIFDEAHYLKGRDTTWTKAALSVIKRNPEARIMLATGTPIPNIAAELFVLLTILHPEQAASGGPLGSYWRWVQEHFHTWQPGWGGPHHVEIGRLLGCTLKCEHSEACPHWRAFHHKWLAGVALGRVWAEGDLPPLVEQVMQVPMTPEQRRVYKALKKDFYVQLESGVEIEVWHGGGVASKLRQVVTGLELLDGNTRASGKLKLLAELLPGRPHPALVVAHHRAAVREILRLCKKLKLPAAGWTGATPKRELAGMVKRFQAGEYAVMVGTIDSVFESVTLTRADTVIFVEHSWVPSRNQQVWRRVRRLGQTRPVHVIRLITTGCPLETRQQRILTTKTDRQMKALRPQEFAAML